MFTICSLYVHHIFTICSLYVHCIFNICSLKVKVTVYLGYVYTGSDLFRSIWDWIHSCSLLCLHGTSSKQERYGSTKDHLHTWTHLVPDSRSSYQFYQVSCKHKTYQYKFRTGSKRIRSGVNAAFIS